MAPERLFVTWAGRVDKEWGRTAPMNDGTSREAAALQQRCWRQEHRIEALGDTIAVLRAGADSLALENLELRLELAELRARRTRHVSRRAARRLRCVGGVDR
jgi:hypothetical protein